MLRSLIVGLGVTVMACSNALAQSCAGNPVAVQVLGSGAPGFVTDRANTSYLVIRLKFLSMRVGAPTSASVRRRRSFPISL